MSITLEGPPSLAVPKPVDMTGPLSDQTQHPGSGAKYPFENLEPYVHPPETEEGLEWCALATLDLSELSQPGGKKRLAAQLLHAVHNIGFFYVKNFGLTQEQVDRQLTLCKNLFDIPLAEKMDYRSKVGPADFNGYLEARSRMASNKKIGDNVEQYNFPKFIPEIARKYTHPTVISEHLPEIEGFARHLHEHVVLQLLRLVAVALELPDEELLARQHVYDMPSADYMGYMKYGKRTPEEHAESGYLQGAGHTDVGSITLLFYQPIASLQIQDEQTRQWKYVKPQRGSITVNIGDPLSLSTAGFLKASIHQVVAPPRDQWAYDRHGVGYFARPMDTTVLKSLINESPVLQAQETLKELLTKPITMKDFVTAKQQMLMDPQLRGGSHEVIAGFIHKNYSSQVLDAECNPVAT